MTMTSAQIAKEQKEILGDQTPLTEEEIENLVDYHWKKAKSKIEKLYDYVGKTILWLKVTDSKAGVIWQSNKIRDFVYIVSTFKTSKSGELLSEDKIDFFICETTPKHYLLSRFYLDKLEENMEQVGQYNGITGAVCNQIKNCQFKQNCQRECASLCVKSSVEEIFQMAEIDAQNIRNGKKIVLITAP